MEKLSTILNEFSEINKNPKAEIKKYLESTGTKAIGCMPIYTPGEIVHAAGMLPVGIWGADREITDAKNYFPAFICSILQTTLDLGIQGEFDNLSGIIIPSLCDSLKAMGQNWKLAVKNVEFIPLSHPQNRKIEPGIKFLKSEYTKLILKMEEISEKKITNNDLTKSIEIFNKHRFILRQFSDLAAQYPHLISPFQRSEIIKSSMFITKEKHTNMVENLILELKKNEIKTWNGKKVILTGIKADNKEFLEILADNNLAIVGDEIAQESRQFRTDVPAGTDAIERLAHQISLIEGCSVLYDPEKKRGNYITELVKKYEADGVIHVLTKFCDPEEYDYPILKKQLEKESIPFIQVEVDQQMKNYEQARTIIQTFSEII
ncbi:MAG: 2-hydroxyacyl-CoA dehydratase subunit D [Fusobacteriaceae bacterium]